MTAQTFQQTPRPRGRAAQGQQSRALYNMAPNRCQQCGTAIIAEPDEKLSEVRKRKFCGRSCAASHNNSLAVAPKRKSRPVWCTDCGAQLTGAAPSQKLCADCRANRSNSLARLTKGESSPADLREHLKRVLAPRPRHCQHCGYDRHVETVHRRPLDSFPDSAPLHDVNHPSNLALLCPNCKWEFEHGLLALEPTHPRKQARA